MPVVRFAHQRHARAITAAITMAVIVAFAAPIGVSIALAQASPVPQEETQVCPEGKSAAECASAGLGRTATSAGLSKQGDKPVQLPVLIGRLINAALSATGIIFVVLMVYAGFLWMQARGDAADVEKAQAIIKNAIIGIVVTGLAFAITNFIISRIAESQIVEATASTAAP